MNKDSIRPYRFTDYSLNFYVHQINAAVPLIVRGWDVPIEEPLPWQATLFERDHKRGGWSFFCGGTLITDRIVLTAGHCVWKMKDKPESIKVRSSLYINERCLGMENRRFVSLTSLGPKISALSIIAHFTI